MGQTVYMGVPTVVESAADRTAYAALFEDDGKVGYFYGLDRRLGERAVLDSVYVYNVGWVLDHPAPDLDVHVPCDVEIVWSGDGHRAALLINGRPHAAFDFAAKRGYCRENFPAGSSWSAAGHAWDDQAVDFLAANHEQREQPGAA
jgi:hypothetical protein